MRRSSGILMHISSLPSPHGIGTIGAAAHRFIDFLAASGQSYWQLLPICPTSYGDSPYQTFSTFAGNPYFIDLDLLAQEGLLKKTEYETIDWESEPKQVNYGALYRKRYPLLRTAVDRFLARQTQDFSAFCAQQADWLEDYALFMTLKDRNGGISWLDWEKPLRDREEEAMTEIRSQYAEDILFWKALQFLFFQQWEALRAYADEKNIRIIGDLPFYVALDSADVWACRELFQLDEEGRPSRVSGCPPDGFSATGQLWGNPLYDWKHHAETGYSWWIRRIHTLCKTYHVLRIDHFRGFDSYYAIPADASDARSGSWQDGPGMALFRALEETVGPQRIIAEDLGFQTDSVKALLEDSGFPGMKVMELAFDRRDPDSNGYLPHTCPFHCVAYTGTHDNDTIQGWFATADPEDTAYAKEYLRLNDPENYHWHMMQALWAAAANLTIVQAQDLLGLGSESRMNTPSTLGANWRWRALPDSFDDALANKLKHYMELYKRG